MNATPSSTGLRHHTLLFLIQHLLVVAIAVVVTHAIALSPYLLLGIALYPLVLAAAYAQRHPEFAKDYLIAAAIAAVPATYTLVVGPTTGFVLIEIADPLPITVFGPG